MCYSVSRVIGLVSVLLLAWSAGAARVNTAQPVVFVPWKVLSHQHPSSSDAFVLYWIPSSPEELRRSELVTSRPLSLYAARCVGMQVVRADDSTRIDRLGVTGLLPIALLIDGDREVARVANDRGELLVDDVEQMVRVAFDEREAHALGQIAEAKRLAGSGAVAAAIDLYRQIAEQRCAFPRLAKEARRALKRLGVR
jgi:hypothetical protein